MAATQAAPRYGLLGAPAAGAGSGLVEVPAQGSPGHQVPLRDHRPRAGGPAPGGSGVMAMSGARRSALVARAHAEALAMERSVCAARDESNGVIPAGPPGEEPAM